MGLRTTEMATLTVESFGVVRGYTTLIFMGKRDKPALVPVPLPALAAAQAPSTAAAPAHGCVPARRRHGPSNRATLRRHNR